MTSPCFGVLAEDDTDGEAILSMAKRILDTEKVSMKCRAGNGCSNLRRKAEPWIRDLVRAGCDHIIILHDLDRGKFTLRVNDELELRRVLDGYFVPPGIAKLICIPIEELEAWFWADPDLIKYVGRGKGKAHPSPERIIKPKEKLQELSRDAGGKPRYSVNDNKTLALKLNPDICARKCRAYRDFRSFVLAAYGRS